MKKQKSTHAEKTTGWAAKSGKQAAPTKDNGKTCNVRCKTTLNRLKIGHVGVCRKATKKAYVGIGSINVNLSLLGPFLPKIRVIDVDIRPVLRHRKARLRESRPFDPWNDLYCTQENSVQLKTQENRPSSNSECETFSKFQTLRGESASAFRNQPNDL